MGKGKTIGSQYEREISAKLSLWLTGSDEELVVWRAVGSGSVGTNRSKKGLSGANVSGDFQCLDSKYEKFFKKYHLDSKCYKECNFLFNNEKNMKSNDIFQQWLKVKSEAARENKIPMMICKIRSRIPEFVIMPTNMFEIINANNVINYSFTDANNDFLLVYLEEFFLLNNWKDLLED